MSILSDINVLWLSYVTLAPGMHIILHEHDYFHFSCNLESVDAVELDSPSFLYPVRSTPPGVIHGGGSFSRFYPAINVMFQTNDKSLNKKIESFPFRLVPREKAHCDFLRELLNQIKRLSPEPEFVNSAFSYYMHLLMEDNKELLQIEHEGSDNKYALCDRCIEFIDGHYSDPVTLDEIAAYAGKSPNYVCSRFSSIYGMTLIEYLNKVRIKHACEMIAYTDINIEDIYHRCGFNNVRNFNRVFIQNVGTTPARYRSSHKPRDLRYSGKDVEVLKQYSPACYTYAVNAQKVVEWKTSYDYLMQRPSEL